MRNTGAELRFAQLEMREDRDDLMIAVLPLSDFDDGGAVGYVQFSRRRVQFRHDGRASSHLTFLVLQFRQPVRDLR